MSHTEKQTSKQVFHPISRINVSGTCVDAYASAGFMCVSSPEVERKKYVVRSPSRPFLLRFRYSRAERFPSVSGMVPARVCRARCKDKNTED